MDRRSRLAAISQRGGGATERDLPTSTVPSHEQPRRQTQHQIACWSVLRVNHVRSDLNPIGCTGFPSASRGWHDFTILIAVSRRNVRSARLSIILWARERAAEP